jgi:hypothetical protein
VEHERFGGLDGQLKLSVRRESGVDTCCLIHGKTLARGLYSENLIFDKNSHSVRYYP